MSLNDKKSQLFGKGPASSSATPNTLKNPIKISAAVTQSISMSKPSNPGITNSITSAQKKVVLEEARDWISKAAKYLETSIFQWTPDYLAAAPCYEKASNLYKGLGDLDKAVDFLVKSANCHEMAGVTTAAALSYSKAAQIAQVCTIRQLTLVIKIDCHT